MNIDRRSFITGSAAAAGIAAAGGIVMAQADEKPFDGAAAFEPESGHAWEIIPEDVPADLISEVIDADVVIVGAGAAGVVASHAAAEAGAKVVLVERGETYSARGHDIGGFNSQFQKDNGVVMDKLDLLKAWCEITMNKTNLGLFNLWLNNSGEVMDYFVKRNRWNPFL